MKVETAKLIATVLLVVYYAVVVGILVYYPIMGRDISIRQFLGWSCLGWLLASLGSAFAKAGDQ